MSVSDERLNVLAKTPAVEQLIGDWASAFEAKEDCLQAIFKLCEDRAVCELAYSLVSFGQEMGRMEAGLKAFEISGKDDVYALYMHWKSQE